MTSPWAGMKPKREPFLKLPWPVTLLLAVMIAVHIALILAGKTFDNFVYEQFGFVPARYAPGAAGHFIGGIWGQIWPFITYDFLHGNLEHIGFNALWLMAVGTPLARRIGSLWFFLFFFICGAAGAGTHLLFDFGSQVPVIGASGAISGCMAGAMRIIFGPFVVTADRRPMPTGELAPLWDSRILFITLSWIGLNWLMGSGLIPIPGQAGAGIAWMAHIGGFLVGLFLMPLFDRWSGVRAAIPGERA